MYKLLRNLTVLFFSLLLLTGCGLFGKSTGSNEEDNDMNQEEVENNEVENNTEEDNNSLNDNEDENDENNDTNHMNNENEVEEEPSFADEVRILDVEEVFFDREEVDLPTEDLLLIHDETTYIAYEPVSELLDYEMRFDPDSSFAEVLEGKEDYTYEPMYEDEGGALLDVGELYIDSNEEYVNPSNNENFSLIEYDGELYIPERILERAFHTPLNYIRKDRELELGLRSEPVLLDGVEVGGTFSLYGGISSDSNYTTVKGDKHDVVAYSNDTTGTDKIEIETDFKFNLMEGFIYNKADETLILTGFNDSGKEVFEIKVDAKTVKEFDMDIAGMEEIRFSVEDTEKAIFKDGYSYVFYGEFY